MARLALQEKQEKICFICETKQNTGITIGSQFMCEACEKSVVSTDANDAKYKFYVYRLERLKTALPRHFRS